MIFLVTGATSGLGRNAVEWLISEGHQVHATGRNNSIGKQLIELGAKFTALDLVTASDQEYQKLLSHCDVIWHCAALSSPWGKYETFYQANVQVTSKLAMWAGKLGIKRFIHISTPSIYFDFKSHYNIDETYLTKRFANNYAQTKHQAELVVKQQVINYPETTYVILRPRGLFGPHDRVIIPRVIKQIQRKNGVLHLPAGGEAYIDLTFVLNVVYALYIATTNSMLISGEIFNITNQQPVHLHTILAQLLQDKLNIKYKIKPIPYKLMYSVACILEGLSALTGKEPMITRYSVGALYFDMTLSQTHAIERLGYRPKYSLQEGIDITADWLKKQGNKNG